MSIVVKYDPKNPDVWLTLREYRRAVPAQFRDKMPAPGAGGPQRTTIRVPPFFAWDGASVPRPFWPLVPRMGRVSGGALVHDYLYTNHIVTRKTADRIFIALWREDVVRGKGKLTPFNFLQFGMAYAAVRLFGGRAWGAVKRTTGVSPE